MLQGYVGAFLDTPFWYMDGYVPLRSQIAWMRLFSTTFPMGFNDPLIEVLGHKLNTLPVVAFVILNHHTWVLGHSGMYMEST